MAADSSATKRIVGLAFAGLGVVANIIGVAGAIGDWGSETTQVVLGPAEAAGAAEETSTTEADVTTTSAAAATTTTLAPAETVEEFLAALGAAFVNGDVEFQVARLHPEVITRYGEDQCRASFADNPPDPTAAFEIVAELGAGDYTWVTDNLTTVIPDTDSVDVVRTVNGQQSSITVHLTLVDSTYRFFSDCGTPI